MNLCFRYNVITYLRHNILWNPQPEKVQLKHFGYTRVLVSRDRRRGDINEAQLSTFLNQMVLQQGSFKKYVVILDKDKDSFWYLEVYVFQLKREI